MENCNLTTNTPLNQGEDPCNGQYKSTECVRESNALTELGISANSTQQEINQAIQNAIFNLQPNTNQAEVLKVKRTLTADEINNIGTTPVELIPAPGVGKSIIITRATAKYNFNTQQFDNNTIEIIASNGIKKQFYIVNLLNSTATIHVSCYIDNTGDFVENDSIIAVGTDSVAVGDSTLDIYITYEIITL